MHSPDLYLKHQSLARDGCEAIIEKYLDLFDQNGNGKGILLDIGCGPGNITHDLIFPLLNGSVRKVIGFDISRKMIDYANAHYANDIFSFKLFDIAHGVPQEYLSYFDYVVSFWTLHWIRDQRKLYSNIYKTMKPNGQMLVSMVARSKMYDIYQSVWRKPQYSPYITDFNSAQSSFQHSEHPERDLQALLEDVGFEVEIVTLEKVSSINGTAATLKEFMASINPFYEKIPEHLKEKFMLDHVREVDEEANLESGDTYSVAYDLFVVYAKKK